MTLNTRQSYAAHTGLIVSGTYTGGELWNLDIRDLDAIPTFREVEESIGAGKPILFPVFFQSTSEGSVPTTTAGSGDVSVKAVFLCCVEHPLRLSEDLNTIGAQTVEVHDAYLTALFGNDDLNNTLAADLSVSAELGVWPWGKDFAGFYVTMTWQYLV
jgi:hypothetical protein